jgi:hypothetical protein
MHNILGALGTLGTLPRFKNANNAKNAKKTLIDRWRSYIPLDSFPAGSIHGWAL